MLHGVGTDGWRLLKREMQFCLYACILDLLQEFIHPQCVILKQNVFHIWFFPVICTWKQQKIKLIFQACKLTASHKESYRIKWEKHIHILFPQKKRTNLTQIFNTPFCLLCAPMFACLFDSVLLYHWCVFACPERGPCSVCMCVSYPPWLLAPVCTDEYKLGRVPYCERCCSE